MGYCTKKKLLPKERHGGYDACRAVHSEQNAIICASREEMLGGTIYLVGYKPKKIIEESESSNYTNIDNLKEYEEGASPCLMCRKMIINAGIVEVYVRKSKHEYIKFDVNDWVKSDEFIAGELHY